MRCTKISAEFECGGHSPPWCAAPKNVALGYDVGKISTGCVVIERFHLISKYRSNLSVLRFFGFRVIRCHSEHYVLYVAEMPASTVVNVCSVSVTVHKERFDSSYGDCLEVKREYYLNSSVLDCVTQCSQSAAHLCEQFLQIKQIGFVTLGPLHCA